MRFAADNGLTGPERELWHVLLQLFNERARGNQFPDGFLRLPNKVVLALLSYSEDTLGRARNRLAQQGLIEFVRGSRREDLPMYRMIWLTASRAPENGAQVYPQDCPQVYPQFAGKNADNTYSNIDVDGTETDLDEYPVSPYTEILEDDEEKQPRARASEEAEPSEDLEEFEGGSPDQQETNQVIRDSFRQHYGRKPHRAELRRIRQTAGILGMPPVMVGIAIRLAAEHNAGAPAMYATQVLNDMDNWGVYDPDAYARHLYHFREQDVDITEQMQEAEQSRRQHREGMRDGFDTGRGVSDRGAAPEKTQAGPGRSPGPAGPGRGPGDGQPVPGQGWQLWDTQARQGGPGGHPPDGR